MMAVDELKYTVKYRSYSKNSLPNILRPIHQTVHAHKHSHTCTNTSAAICSSVHTVSTAWWQLAHGVLVWCCHSRRNGHLFNGRGATLSEELEYLTHGVLHCHKNCNIKQAGRDVVIATGTLLKKSHVKPRWAPGAVVWTCGLAVAYCASPMAC